MTDPTPLHRHSVAQILQESGLSRAAFYKRIAQAGVKLIRVPQNSLLERGQLEALRALEDWIQGCGRSAVFPGRLQPSPDVALFPSAVRDFPSAVAEEAEEDQEAPEALVAAAVSHLDGLLTFLTKAARNSWELPTSQVQLLVRTKPRGATFSISSYGFSFRPSGRHDQETSWRVER